MTASAITALNLGNFKAFANLQRIPLKPLTFKLLTPPLLPKPQRPKSPIPTEKLGDFQERRS
jgi:hypothetical protein